MTAPGAVPDVFDPRVFTRGIPHDDFRRLRDEAPVCRQDEHAVDDWPAGPGYWAVTRYQDVRDVLRDPAVTDGHPARRSGGWPSVVCCRLLGR